MAGEVMQARVEKMFDALVDYDIEDYEQLAEVLGWQHATVNTVMNYVRSHAEEVGFTVPHVSRGVSDGTRLYRAVLVGETDHNLNKEERHSLLVGGRATSSTITALGNHETVALRACVPYVDAKTGRKLLRLAKMLEGAAAMAEDAREALDVAARTDMEQSA